MSVHNPDQFKLFYGAQELQSSITHSYDVDPGEGDTNLQSMWDRKLAESKMPQSSGVHGSGVYESLAREGVRPHTRLTVKHETGDWDEGHPQSIEEGHHRVAAAADIERTTGRAMWINVDNYDYNLKGRVQQGLKPLHSGLHLAAKMGKARPVGGNLNPQQLTYSGAARANQQVADIMKLLGP